MTDSASEQSPFAAPAAAMGYLFQVRFALVELLRRYREDPGVLVWIENLDDVQFEDGAAAIDLIQTKHSIQRRGDLTDRSTDLWGTIRVWADVVGKPEWARVGTLCIVTTGAAPVGSVAALLRSDGARNEPLARERLERLANTEPSVANRAGYAAFLKIDGALRDAFVSKILVIDATSTIVDIADQLRAEIAIAAPLNRVDMFVELVEGWWYSTVIAHLAESGADPISGTAIHSRISDMREQFKADNLPELDEILNVTDVEDEKRGYVQQLALIEVGGNPLRRAVQDYYKAFGSRSRWLREELLVGGEWEKYERRLREEWQIRFDRMVEQMDDPSDSQLVALGRQLFQWMEEDANFPIRQMFPDRAICRGSFHMLADDLRVGWHPEFVSQLKHVLRVEETG